MNYFHYFSEIEERFSRRRGSALLLSTLDWALIETWREAGVPLEAVLRGIDDAFDKHDARRLQARGRVRSVNGLAWCAQAVMHAAEQQVEASTGVAPGREPAATDRPARESGFEGERVAAYLERNAVALDKAAGTDETVAATARRLHALALDVRSGSPPALDALDRTLTVLEEKLFAALQAAATEDELVALQAQADRELAAYRARMSALQLRQIQQQLLRKRLLERHAIPRLSLFHMGLD